MATPFDQHALDDMMDRVYWAPLVRALRRPVWGESAVVMTDEQIEVELAERARLRRVGPPHGPWPDDVLPEGSHVIDGIWYVPHDAP